MNKNRAAFLVDYEALMYKHGLCLVTYDGVDEIDPEDIPEEIKSFGEVPKGPPVIPERIAKAIQPDGDLDWESEDLDIQWKQEWGHLSLEGVVSAAEMRAVADHMEKNSKP